MKNSLFILCSLILFSSCTKEMLTEALSGKNTSKPTAPVDLSKLIKSSKVIRPAGRDTTITNYEYDNQGRILKVTSKSVNDVYAYGTGYYTVTGKYLKKFYMVSGNKDDSLIIAAPNDTSSEKYIRDGDGQLVTVKQYNWLNGKTTLRNVITNTYAGGNITRTTNSSNLQVTDYAYTNYPYQNNIGLIYSYTNKNLINTEIVTGSAIKGTYYYDYQFDNVGRITHMVYRASFGVLSDETYTY